MLELLLSRYLTHEYKFGREDLALLSDQPPYRPPEPVTGYIHMKEHTYSEPSVPWILASQSSQFVLPSCCVGSAVNTSAESFST